MHTGPLNRVMWPELATPDPGHSVAFYSILFGWKTNPDTGIEAAPYIERVHGAASIAGLLPRRRDRWKGVPPDWMIYKALSRNL